MGIRPPGLMLILSPTTKSSIGTSSCFFPLINFVAVGGVRSIKARIDCLARSIENASKSSANVKRTIISAASSHCCIIIAPITAITISKSISNVFARIEAKAFVYIGMPPMTMIGI